MAAVDDDEIGFINVEALEGRVATILMEELKPRPAARSSRLAGGAPVAPGGKFSSDSSVKGAVINACRRAFTEALGSTRPAVVTFAAIDADVVLKTVRSVLACVPELVRERQAALRETDIEALVRVMMPTAPTSDALLALMRDNASGRKHFLEEIPCLNSKQVQETAGHKAANASITASRWKKQGKIFSIPVGGTELYPAFQFRDGQPHPSVAKMLAALPKRKSPWQIAFWFTSSNSWLRGATPMERLDDEAAVVMAAQREAEEVVG